MSKELSWDIKKVLEVNNQLRKLDNLSAAQEASSSEQDLSSPNSFDLNKSALEVEEFNVKDSFTDNTRIQAIDVLLTAIQKPKIDIPNIVQAPFMPEGVAVNVVGLPYGRPIVQHPVSVVNHGLPFMNAIGCPAGVDGAQLQVAMDDGIHLRFRPTLSDPLVLGKTSRNFLTNMAHRDRTVLRRSKPSSRTALNSEQLYPWSLI